MGVDMAEHSLYLTQLAEQCNYCTEFGVRDPDDTSSTMSLLRGVITKLTSYDIVRCWTDRPVRLASERGVQFEFVCANVLEVDIEPTDLLMIDTYHSYQQLKAELNKHADKALKYLVFHDTKLFGVISENGSPPGLQQALDEFRAEHPKWILHFHTDECCGLTVLRRECEYSSQGSLDF